MENNVEKKVYNTRIIPFVRNEENKKNGKLEKIDNLSNEEIKNMSCEPRMLWQNVDHVYIAERPLMFHEGTSVKWSLCYVFDELTKEEQKKYFDRSIVIPTTIEKVVQVYGDSSKRFFGRRKVKERK